MNVTVLKSKIHNAHVTEANIDYIGSITIDEELMKAANLLEGEQVHVINYTNGERLITYTIPGEKNTGKICMNGPAALKIREGDKIIIISYAAMPEKEALKFKPTIIFPGLNNSLANLQTSG